MEEQPASYPLKVLIVEDSVDDALFAIQALQAGRYEPFWKRVETASEMKRELLETKWELIIADHRLPSFSALEAFDIYRQFQLDIPFIIVSGVMGEEIAVAAMRAGVHDYLSKDNLARLGPAVHRELGEAESRRERKRAELELVRQSATLRQQAQMINLSADAIIMTSPDRIVSGWNAGAAEMYGWTEAEAIGQSTAVVLGTSAAMALQVDEVLRRDGRWEGELVHNRRGGQSFIVESHQVLVRDESGAAAGILGINRDITERKQAELRVRDLNRDLDRQLLKVQKASAEKDVLLREVQHRVKNNLQVISSMLSLEARRLGKGAALNILQNNRDRIRSMALIHEKFCYSEDVARINFGEYVSSLAGYFMSSYASTESTIALSTDVELELEMDDAIPCGLILQELLSNSMKYAFPDGTGTITIEFHCVAGEPRLRYRDSGPGLPRDVDIHHPASLGLQLVNDLVSQLQGRLEYQNSNGATFEMSFKSAQERKASD